MYNLFSKWYLGEKNHLLNTFWLKDRLSHIAYNRVFLEEHCNLNHFLMVPTFEFHRSFYECDV